MQLDSIAEERILVLAPKGRDAQVIEQVLSQGGFTSRICLDYEQLLAELDIGAGALLFAEEALFGIDLNDLIVWLAKQPSWSEFPFVMLVSNGTDIKKVSASILPEQLGYVVVLERPVNADTLRRAAASALRGRQRQYQARSALDELRMSKEAVLSLNQTLESRIEERTAGLAAANDRLMREIVERERAQKALIQTQKMEAIGQLTGGIAHDFNNLLSIVLGNMDLIALICTDERVKRMAETARRAAERGAKLTGQLLAFSRTQHLDLKATDLLQVMDGVNHLLSASLGSDVDVHFDLEKDIPLVKADLQQVELAILNLAINARDAMPKGGKITIQTRKRRATADILPAGEYAVISVIDEGEGINPEIIGKVFDPFFTTKPMGKGTGLGLSQVYGIAQQSGGTARVLSKVDVGTTVEIWLMLAGAADVAASFQQPVLLRSADERRIKILLVEDEPEVRQFMVECLETLGYRVAQAHDGNSALKLLSTNRPDLMITDFLMPGMTGAELVSKAHATIPNLPVIIATGYADMEAIADVQGKVTIVRKPFQINTLVSSVQQALGAA
jgi:signal transduction histidine kinase